MSTVQGRLRTVKHCNKLRHILHLYCYVNYARVTSTNSVQTQTCNTGNPTVCLEIMVRLHNEYLADTVVTGASPGVILCG